MKKKITAIALVVCLIAVAVVGGTLAYFTDTDEAENVFTVGNVMIDLSEPNWKETGSVDAESVYPGEPLAKDPTVENVGANPCFVRIKVEGLDQFGEKGNIIYRTNYKDGELHDGWVRHTDGYFYWTKPLVVKGTENDSWNNGLPSVTAPLFDQIVMPTGLTGNENSEDGLSVLVTAEAVQAQGAKPAWADVKNMTVAEIAAWFTTCGVGGTGTTTTE